MQEPPPRGVPKFCIFHFNFFIMAELASPFIPKEASAFRSHIAGAGGAWLFQLALVAFIAALVAAGGLFFYQRSLEATYADWQEQVRGQEEDLRPELLAEVSDLSSGISVARELLSSHVFASNAFILLQSVTHPFVSFNSMALSRDAKKIELSGVASSYRSVAEQVGFFETHPQVEKVDFGGLSVGERGLVNFRLAVIFKPSLLRGAGQ